VRTSARIVILGAGAGGAAMANRLARRLDGAQITVVDGRAQHWYQPGFTLIAAGLKPASYAISGTTDWLPRGVDLHAPTTPPRSTPRPARHHRRQRLDYDYLIVATGLVLDWDAIEGFSLDMVGPETGSAPITPAPNMPPAGARWTASPTEGGGRCSAARRPR
jgi:sulfide:quinone oxidoreductase